MILVAGSANLDFVVRAPRIPAPGETVLGREFQTFPGGKGANQAVACARAGGARTHLLMALGADPFAAPNLPVLGGFSHLLLQLETPLETVAAYAQTARTQGITVVLNAAPACPLSVELLALVDVLVVNEGELTALAPQVGSIAQKLEHLGVPCGVVTLGARGCCARQGDQWWPQPGYAVNALDSTAAGDTFCGALTAALSQQEPLADALRLASAAAALACTRLGAQSSIPLRSAVHTFLHAQPTPSSLQLEALLQYCGLPKPTE